MRSIFLGISFLFCTLALFVRSGIAFQSEYFNISAEAAGLVGVLNLVENKSLYPPRFSEPYSIFLYNPLLPYFSAFLIRLFDLNDLYSQVLLVRGIVVLTFLMLLGSLIVLLKEFQCKISPFFVLVFLLGGAKFFDYIGTSRNDIPSLLFEILGVITFVFFLSRGKIAFLIGSIVTCHLAFWIRQSSIVIPIASLLWLLYTKRLYHLWAGVFLNCILSSLYIWFMFSISGASFVDHVVLANIRPWKPVNLSLITSSNISFFLSQLLFIFALFKNFKTRKSFSETEGFLTFVIGLSASYALVSWFRAGGDFNYFFLAILLSFPFVYRELSSGWNIPRLRMLISLQLFLIGLIYSLKIQSSFSILTHPFQKEMKSLRSELKPSGNKFLLFSGKLSESAALYFRDIALHGPEITSGCWLSKGSHPQLNWLYRQANEATKNGKVFAVIDATPHCRANQSFEREWLSLFSSKRSVSDSICIYEIPSKKGIT